MAPPSAVRALAAGALALALSDAASALELKAIVRRPEGDLAYFLDGRGRFVTGRAGHRVHDQLLLAIGEDSVWLRPDSWPGAPSGDYRLGLGPATTTLPSATPVADSVRVSLDLRYDDPHHALRLLIEAEGGADFVIHEDVRTPVTLGVRDAPVEAAQARLLDGSGVCRRRRGRFLVVARCEDLPPEGPPLEGPRPDPINIELVRADSADVLRLFADISGFLITLPDELAGRKVTIWAHDRPWDEVLDAMLAVHGMAWRVDGNRILIARRRP